MKRRIRFLLIAAVTLIAILGGCDTGNGDNPSVPPITFTGTWVEPTWFDGDVNSRMHSRFNIFEHYPTPQKIFVDTEPNGSFEYDTGYDFPAAPRVFTVNPDWTFTYTGGFAQARQNLVAEVKAMAAGALDSFSDNQIYAIFVPPVRVEGIIAYEEGDFYAIIPKKATVILEGLGGGMDNMVLPPETVMSFEESAVISMAGGYLIIDDMPQTVTNAKGILRGIWTKQ
jgi:hypothetical protein